MASDTSVRLRDAALDLFSSRWYETVSIAEICRRADLSNGVFYRYYRGKEELVRALLDDFLEHLAAELTEPPGETLEERVASLVRSVYDAGIHHAAEVTVFREGQYRLPEYEDRLREIYLQACTRVFGRDVSEAEYLYTISGLRFTSTRALYDGLSRKPEHIAAFILDGVFPGATPEITVPKVFPSIPEEQPADSRERLLQSGMRLIGRRGYHKIGIAEIVRETGLAVGTFYTYFTSKEEFFSAIVERIGQRTRRYLSEQARTHGSRPAQEAYGVWHFLSYFSEHQEYYSIIREAEFVAKPWVRRYYDTFESGYMKNLPIEDSNTRRIAANFLMGLSHYVGIEALLNHRIPNIPAFFRELTDLMCKGVQR